MPPGARFFPTHERTMRLRAVLNYLQMITLRDRHHPRHIHRLTVKMHRDNGLNRGITERLEQRLDRSEIDQHRRRINIDELRRRARRADGRNRSGNRVGHRQDFVAGPNPNRPQRQLKGIRTIGHAHHLFDPKPIRKFLFEGDQLRSHNINPTSHDPLHRGINGRLRCEISRFRISWQNF